MKRDRINEVRMDKDWDIMVVILQTSMGSFQSQSHLHS